MFQLTIWFLTQFVLILLKQQILYSPDSVLMIKFPNVLTGQYFRFFFAKNVYAKFLLSLKLFISTIFSIYISIIFSLNYYDNSPSLKIMASGEYVLLIQVKLNLPQTRECILIYKSILYLKKISKDYSLKIKIILFCITLFYTKNYSYIS